MSSLTKCDELPAKNDGHYRVPAVFCENKLGVCDELPAKNDGHYRAPAVFCENKLGVCDATGEK
jgi:hypothetical protein